MNSRQFDKRAVTETSRLTQMYDGSYQDMQRSTSEKFAQNKYGKFPESEHQKANVPDDYQQIESNFTPYDNPPYNPAPFPARYGTAPLGKPANNDTDYASVVFNCWGYYCCDGNKLSGNVKIVCTYPIIRGPWVDLGGGNKCELPINGQISGETGSRGTNVCMAECMDTGTCPPKMWVMLQAPPQTRLRNGKKETWPGKIQQQGILWLNSKDPIGGCPQIPSICCTGVSITGMTQMSVGQSQTLTATGPVSGCKYQMRITSGKGTLVVNGANSYLYTAPSTNPGCVNNVTVGLFDVEKCQMCASISIAINNPAVTGVAVRSYGSCVSVCTPEIGCTPQAGGTASTYKKAYEYNCNGSLSLDIQCNGCSTACNGCVCPPIATICASCNCSNGPPADCIGSAGDLRTAQMKADGCCPAQLI